MATLEHCIDLNNQAIACMKEGKFVESSLILNNALENLECYLDVPPTELVISCCAYSSVSIESQRTQHIARNASPENVFTFYPRMFHITCKGRVDSMELIKVKLIIMFNEALTRHAIALEYLSQYKSNPSAHLPIVLGLYQKVVFLAQRCFQYHDIREMLCVLVAATNNYGHVASQLLLFSETRDSISHMMHLLAISGKKSFHKDDVRLFLESVCIFLEGHNLRNAPAA